MKSAPAEPMKEYANSQQSKSTADIMDAMKDMFGYRKTRCKGRQIQLQIFI